MHHISKQHRGASADIDLCHFVPYFKTAPRRIRQYRPLYHVSKQYRGVFVDIDLAAAVGIEE
jgi:hypothetical protein